MSKFISRLAQGALLAAASLAVGSCGNEYTYFTVNMSFATTSENSSNGLDKQARDKIGACVLKILSDGKEVDQFDLAQKVDSAGSKWGCATGSTGSYIGSLNYSSIRPAGHNLKFVLLARTDEGVNSKDLAEGEADGNTSPGNIVQVDVKAALIK